MRLQLLSDIHLEFHQDGGRAFIESLDPEGVDVLVLAGDVTVADRIPDALRLVCQHYGNATVLYVHGNHEFYGTSRPNVITWTKQAVKANPNLRWLDCDHVVVDGRRFLGAPLWFRDDLNAHQYRRGMTDFHVIKGFTSWVFKENDRAVKFLRSEMRQGDIVITHHLPSPRSISPYFKNSSLNAFFVCNMEREMIEHKPALWLHGHTHASLDYRLGDTRVLCNPLGYPHSINRQFQEHRVLNSMALEATLDP